MESFFPYHCSFRPEISRLLRQCNYKLTVSDVEKGTTYLNCYRFILLLFFPIQFCAALLDDKGYVPRVIYIISVIFFGLECSIRGNNFRTDG